MKAYLDNNIVSAITKDDNRPESVAIDRLMIAYEADKVELVTSQLTLDEIQSCPAAYRPPLERTFRLMQKVPLVRWDELLGMNSYGDQGTWISSPRIQNDPLFDQLLKCGLAVMDARHVFVAARNSCDSFITCDGGIIARAAQIAKLCAILVEKPSAFVARHGF